MGYVTINHHKFAASPSIFPTGSKVTHVNFNRSYTDI